MASGSLAASTESNKTTEDACIPSSAPFICAYVRDVLLGDSAFGETVEDRRRLLLEGGLTINTTIDPITQEAARSSAEEVVPDGRGVAAGVVVVEPGSGRVQALAVNRRYGPTVDELPSSQINDFEHATEIYPLDPDSFSPGSTFMTFALAAALEKGMPLSTTFYAPACYHSNVFNNPEPGDCYGNTDPNEEGFFSLTTATWRSVNAYYIQLTERVGVLDIAEVARRLGVSSCRVEELRKSERCKGIDGVGRLDGALALGSHEISTLDLATAYATLAARGLRCDPKVISSITRDGRDVSHATGRPCQQVLDPELADKVSAVLQGVINHGTASGNGMIGRPAVGKTGTTQDFRTASFAGYIPQLSVAVTLADLGKPTLYPLQDGQGLHGVYGGGLPARIWAYTMKKTIEGHNLPVAPLPPPDNTQPRPFPAQPATNQPGPG